MGAQRPLIYEIQEELTRSARAELAALLGPMPPALRRYKRRYDEDVSDLRSITTRAHLIDRVRGCDLLYLGDYHTLRQSQKTLMRILKELREERAEIFVGLEMIHEGQQEMVDRFVSGEVEEAQLLEQINYWEDWGFSWRNYRQIFNYGRKHGVRLVGLELDARSDRRSLGARDRHAARTVARLTEQHPGALVVVFYGDFHVARQHIPRLVEQRLERRGLKRERVICHQNAEPIYWLLLAEQQVHSVDVVRLGEDRYCVMNTPPWIKYTSYIDWLAVPKESRRAYQQVAVSGKKGLRDAGELYPEVEVEIDIDDQFHTMAERAGRLLGQAAIDLSGFRPVAIFDANLGALMAKLELSKRASRDLSARLVTFGSVLIPDHDLIYFADPGVNLLAEQAARLLRHQALRAEPAARDAREQLYREVLDAAFGFFGSKLVNYKRKCNKVDDYRRFLIKHRHLRRDPGLDEHRRAARLILAHKEHEERIARGRAKRVRLRTIFRMPPYVHHRVVKGLGYMMGNRLYQALMHDEIELQEILDSFLKADARRSARRHERAYLRLCERLRETSVGVESKADRF